MPRRGPTNEVERFWAKVVKHEGDSCWDFLGAVRGGTSRYKIFMRSGSNKMVYAHRYMYALVVGEIQAGLVVRHKCDNRFCVNPSHLCVGSYADNSHDAVERGRTARGERGGTSKFTEEDVHEIRRLWRSGVRQVELARRYNVTQPAISAVCTGKNWGHV